MPVTSARPRAVTTVRTVISFLVRVPVLSEAITVAEPKVSTAGSLRTMALRRAIRRTPSARVVVTIAGKPSGTAATANYTEDQHVEKGREVAYPVDEKDRGDNHRRDDEHGATE